MADSSGRGGELRDGRRRFPEAEYPLQQLSGTIITAFREVYRAFGFGFLESVYRRALAVELTYRGVTVAQEVSYELSHRGVSVGSYRADLVAERAVVVETKTGLILDPSAPAQLLNYLSASRLPVGLVLYFGPRPAIKRIVASRARIETLE
jgi:GxxExxY protein